MVMYDGSRRMSLRVSPYYSQRNSHLPAHEDLRVGKASFKPLGFVLVPELDPGPPAHLAGGTGRVWLADFEDDGDLTD